MVSIKEDNGTYTIRSSYTENRGPSQVGFISVVRHQEWVKRSGRTLWNLIEFQVRETLPHHLQSAVVYAGSTCPRQTDGGEWSRLKSRIINYCRHGNLKAFQVNDALSRGYELWVRYKQARSGEEAKAWENTLLAMYDYAWNVRNNGNIRVVP